MSEPCLTGAGVGKHCRGLLVGIYNDLDHNDVYELRLVVVR